MKSILYTTLLTLIPTITFSASICNTNNSNTLNLEQVYKLNRIRVYYSINPDSEHNIPDKTDLNKNSVPDYVENMAIQISATADALNYIGFIPPLESKRYKNVASYIDVNLMSQSGGVAYEIPARYPQIANKGNSCALLMNISNKLDNFPGTWSLGAHELFHLYQYGYSQFKRGWYGEASANWAERVIRSGGYRPFSPMPSLPQTQEQLQLNIYDNHYNALFSRISEIFEKNNGYMNLPNEILNRKYLNGSKVILDDKLSAHVFMVRFMDNLRLKSEEVSYQNNLDPYAWGSRKSLESNNPIILKVIQDTMYQFGMNKTPEEINFLKLK